MRRAAALLLLSLALGAPACAYGRRVQAPYRVPGVLTGPVAPDRGRFLYQRDCSWCHGPRGEGTVRAPDLVTDANGTAMTDFMLSTGRMPLDFPRQRATRRPPAYGRKDIAAIVGYVATFGQAGSNIPRVDLATASLTQGEELYQENCAACHASVGVGGALQYGRLAPTLRESTPVQVAEAIRVGPGAMPVFGHPTFTKHQVDSIVRYVVYLQHPENRGGFSLGNIGPITEGMVGLLVGVGLLLAVIRYIGTTVGD